MKNSILALGLLALLGLVSAHATYLYPNGIHDGYDAWYPFGCYSSSEYQCIDEYTTDASDYLYANSDGKLELLTMTNLPAGATTVEYVVVGYYAKRYNSDHDIFFPFLGVDSYSGSIGVVFTNADWTWYNSERMYVNPLTSNPWTVSDVNNLHVGMYSGSASPGSRIALIRVLVGYD